MNVTLSLSRLVLRVILRALFADDLRQLVPDLDDNPFVSERLTGIGLGQPYHLGSWLRELELPASSFKRWDDFDFATALANATGLPVFSENDGNAAAIAELPPRANPHWHASQDSQAESAAPYRILNIGNSQPVRLLAHPRMGLWASMRGAVALSGLRPLPAPPTNPCAGCAAPCATVRVTCSSCSPSVRAAPAP